MSGFTFGVVTLALVAVPALLAWDVTARVRWRRTLRRTEGSTR